MQRPKQLCFDFESFDIERVAKSLFEAAYQLNEESEKLRKPLEEIAGCTLENFDPSDLMHYSDLALDFYGKLAQ